MRQIVIVILLIVALMAGLTGCQKNGPSRPAAMVAVAVSAPAGGQAPTDCLDCHGPFDKLVAATANYVTATGEKTSPHRYVPHDSKLEKDIPGCRQCHTAHPLSPLPAKGSMDLSQVKVEWCFTCHHEKNFQSCKDCHP